MAVMLGRMPENEMYTTISFDDSSSHAAAVDVFPPRPRTLIDRLKQVTSNGLNIVIFGAIVTAVYVVVAVWRSVEWSAAPIQCVINEIPVDVAAAQREQYLAGGKSYMVATDNTICSHIAEEVLADGGFAIDAAIAAAFCLGVVSPASSGLGGGCFILSYNANNHQAKFIDARETAPAAAYQDMFVSDPILAQDGGLAIATLAVTV